MPLSAQAEQDLILARTGDLDPTTGQPPVPGVAGVVKANLGNLWVLYADRAAIAPRLQGLYVQRDAYDLLIGVVQDEVDIAIGQGSDSEKLSQRSARLQTRRAAVQTEIERIERRSMANRVPAIGQITQTAPIMAPQPDDVPDPDLNDANSPAYSGSPYFVPMGPTPGRVV